VLHTHDRYGHRRDEVEFHPAWHNVMRLAVEHRIHSLPWSNPGPGAHVARAALAMLASENEAGHVCPISMTYSVVPVLRRDPELAAEWEPRLDFERLRFASAPGVGENRRADGHGDDREAGRVGCAREHHSRRTHFWSWSTALHGHKWFCSGPMCDAFLVLAQAPGGLSCFFCRAGRRMAKKTHSTLQRLKSKLGIARTLRAKSNSTAPGRAGSATKAAASRPLSKWSTTRDWIV
jgi:putative acyl-CoA dehydrogenase